MAQPNALDSFVATKLQIDSLLERLQQASDEHLGVSPDSVDWGHVGEALRVKVKLEEALAMALGAEP